MFVRAKPAPPSVQKAREVYHPIASLRTTPRDTASGTLIATATATATFAAQPSGTTIPDFDTTAHIPTFATTFGARRRGHLALRSGSWIGERQRLGCWMRWEGWAAR